MEHAPQTSSNSNSQQVSLPYSGNSFTTILNPFQLITGKYIKFARLVQLRDKVEHKSTSNKEIGNSRETNTECRTQEVELVAMFLFHRV